MVDGCPARFSFRRCRPAVTRNGPGQGASDHLGRGRDDGTAGLQQRSGRGEGKRAGRVEDEIELFRQGGRVEAETHDRFDAQLVGLVGRTEGASRGA